MPPRPSQSKMGLSAIAGSRWPRGIDGRSCAHANAAPRLLAGEQGRIGGTFWLVEALTRAGRLDEARFIFEKMLTYANHLGLYAEEIGPCGEAAMEEGLKCRGRWPRGGGRRSNTFVVDRVTPPATRRRRERRDRHRYPSLAQRDGEGPGERAQCGCDALAYFTASVAAEELRWVGPATLAR
jgi:hypothetical protein